MSLIIFLWYRIGTTAEITILDNIAIITLFVSNFLISLDISAIPPPFLFLKDCIVRLLEYLVFFLEFSNFFLEFSNFFFRIF